MSQNNTEIAIVTEVVTALTGNTDFNITRTTDEKGVLIFLRTTKPNIGRIIGKKGRTINAIRTLLRCLGARNNANYNFKVDLYEDETQATAESMAS